jgi:hypothetical protein
MKMLSDLLKIQDTLNKKMHSYVNTKDIHNRFVEQKENKIPTRKPEEPIKQTDEPATKVLKDPNPKPSGSTKTD